MSATPGWVEPLCRIAEDYKRAIARLCDPDASGAEPRSILQQFVEAAPDLSDEDRARFVVQEYLAERPDLIEAWQTYSYDKRTTPSPYLDGMEVGYFEGHRRDVVVYEDRSQACADFICREAKWVLERYGRR